LTSFVNIQVRD